MAVRINSDASVFRRTANLPPGTSFTIAGWFNFVTVTPARFWSPMMVSNAVDGSAYCGLASTTSGGAQLGLTYSDSGGSEVQVALLTVSANQWYFIAVTRSGTASGNAIAYIRALQDKAFTSVASSGAANALTPGNIDWGRDGFTGEFMDGDAFGLCAFDSVLTARELMLLSNDLLSENAFARAAPNVYFRLRGNNDLWDRSGNARHPTVTAGVDRPSIRTWRRRRRVLSTTSGTTYNMSVSEAATAADTVAAALVAIGAIAETGSAADTVSSLLAGACSLSETGSASDSMAGALAAVTSLAESGAAADVVSSLVVLVGALSESGTANYVVDGTVGAASYNVSLIEAGSAADTIGALIIASMSLSESGSVADAISAARITAPGLTESGAAGDAMSGQVIAVALVSEALAGVDSIAAAAVLVGQLIEAGAAVDVITTDALFQNATTRNVIAERRYVNQEVGARAELDANAPRAVDAAPSVQVVIVTAGSRTVH